MSDGRIKTLETAIAVAIESAHEEGAEWQRDQIREGVYELTPARKGTLLLHRDDVLAIIDREGSE